MADKKPAQDTTKADDAKPADKSAEEALYGKDGKPSEKKPGDEKPGDDKKADDKKADPIGKPGDDKKADEKKEPEKKPESKDKPNADDKGAGDDKKKDDAGDDSKDKGDKDDKGKPESKVPDKYELTRPDDELWTDADVENVAAHAKALGLTQEQAARELELRYSGQKAEHARLLEALKADPELGGTKFDKTVDVANRGLRAAMKLLPEADQDAMLSDLLVSGRQNARWFVRLMSHFADATAEDQPDHSGKGGAGDRKTDAEVFYGTK